MDVIKEEPVSIPEAKAIMDERAKDKNLAYEQKICVEYFSKIPHLTKAKAQKMKEELSQIASLKPSQIAMIINILPDTQDEFLLIFGKQEFKKEEMQSILEIVAKYRKKSE